MVPCPGVPVAYPDADVPIAANRSLPGRPTKRHRHTDADWEIGYVDKGEADYHVAGRPFHLAAGDVVIIRPDDCHECLAWSGERHTVMFRETLLGAMPVRVRCSKKGIAVGGTQFPVTFSISRSQRPTMVYVFERIQQEAFGKDATKRAMCTALLAQLLLDLARSAKTAGEREPEVVSPVARETIEDLCNEVRQSLDELWTLDELVRRSGYSATQLTVLFNHVTGMSPCHWLSQERVQQACELLAQTDMNATQVACEVGFGSRSQFHRAFREFVGTTPIRYQSIVRHEEKP
ncbi:MAG: AraC family transcriptional regulator [Planctomycetes bacterium]|nr:AraC family transcriptional regulator [Planctomycetota bacterium]